MKAAPLNPGLLKEIKVGDLEPREFEELRQIANQFGDIALVSDRNTLYSLYEIARLSKKSLSVKRKKAASKLEKFVMSASATRRLYYGQHQESRERKSTLGARLSEPEEPHKGRKKRIMGEHTVISKR